MTSGSGPRPASLGLLGVLIGMCSLLTTSCAYTVARVPPLDEAVRVEIAVDDARLVRAQAYLQSSVATALQYQLGWKVSPTGSARITLTLKEEIVQTIATTSLDVPASWSITIRGNALFDSRHGHALTTYTGAGYTTPGNGFESALASEPAALQAASDAAAAWLAVWLQGEAQKWK
jgi:hypothetical protein